MEARGRIPRPELARPPRPARPFRSWITQISFPVSVRYFRTPRRWLISIIILLRSIIHLRWTTAVTETGQQWLWASLDLWKQIQSSQPPSPKKIGREERPYWPTRRNFLLSRLLDPELCQEKFERFWKIRQTTSLRPAPCPITAYQVRDIKTSKATRLMSSNLLQKKRIDARAALAAKPSLRTLSPA